MPKVTVHANGKCTLSGLTVADMDSLLCMAFLHHNSDKFVPQKLDGHLDDVVAFNNKVNEGWHNKMDWLIKSATESLKAKTAWPKEPLTLKEQLKKNKKERDFLNDLLANCVSEPAKKLAKKKIEKRRKICHK